MTKNRLPANIARLVANADSSLSRRGIAVRSWADTKTTIRGDEVIVRDTKTGNAHAYRWNGRKFVYQGVR